MSVYGTRNGLARIVLEKIENDNVLQQLDRNEWYSFDTTTLAYDIGSKFLRLHEDAETSKFLLDSEEKSNWLMTQIFHSLMLTVFRVFMSTTSINGLLQRGSMFVFSANQFQDLTGFQTGFKLDSLLDLGAGDGAVTDKMAPFFNKVYATEMSVTMQWRLKQRGYNVVDVENWHSIVENYESLKFDAISALNLFDRCDKPLTLLKTIKATLKPNGYLIVALVLPFKPYVEYNKGNKPTENLFDFSNAKNVSEQINALIGQVFQALGFELVRFTRLPYLCEGNISQSYYYLIDYVFIFKNV